MSGSSIRVRYSGLIIFAAQMVSVGTGFVFTLLLTRNLTKQEYGIWSNIFDSVGYFTLFSGIIPFWTLRFVARGREGSVRTGLAANLMVALASLAVYLPVISLVTAALNIGPAYAVAYLVASVQITNVHLIGMLESCLRAVKPQRLAAGLLVEEVFKIALAYVLIVRLHQVFLGALASVLIAALIQALFYLKLLDVQLRQKIQWGYLREWLKGSTANLYYAVGNQLAAFTLILLFVYGGYAARGDYQAAATFANIVGYSGFLAFALYPTLLTRKNLEDVTLSLKTMLMFSIPMAAIAVVMSPTLLTLLSPAYAVAWPILVILIVDTIALALIQFYGSLLLGGENLDQESRIPLRKLATSRLFKFFSLPYVQAIITLPAVLYALTQAIVGQGVDAALFVAVLTMAAHMVTLLLSYIIMPKPARPPFLWKSIGKYALAAAVSGIVLWLVPHPTTIVPTVAVILVGIAVYATVLLPIERDARELVASVLREIGIVKPRESGQKA